MFTWNDDGSHAWRVTLKTHYDGGFEVYIKQDEKQHFAVVNYIGENLVSGSPTYIDLTNAKKAVCDWLGMKANCTVVIADDQNMRPKPEAKPAVLEPENPNEPGKIENMGEVEQHIAEQCGWDKEKRPFRVVKEARRFRIEFAEDGANFQTRAYIEVENDLFYLNDEINIRTTVAGCKTLEAIKIGVATYLSEKFDCRAYEVDPDEAPAEMTDEELADAIDEAHEAKTADILNQELAELEADKEKLGADDKAIIDTLIGSFNDFAARTEKRFETTDDDIANIKLDINKAVVKLNQKIDTLQPQQIVVKLDDNDPVKIDGLVHKDFEKILTYARAGVNQMLVGPAGSGKTTLCMQLADAMGLKFYMTGAVTQPHYLTGYKDMHGKYVETALYKAVKHGGVFLWDEMDRSHPAALVAFNAVLANDTCDFPCGTVKKHKNFVCIAAANTYGRGADRQYTTGQKLDASTTDRFAVQTFDYDEALERQIVGNDNESQAWVEQVIEWRNAMFDLKDLKSRHVISPRASIEGAKMLRAGRPIGEVADVFCWKGLDKGIVNKIKRQATQNKAA